jgi:hypothetical protein
MDYYGHRRDGFRPLSEVLKETELRLAVRPVEHGEVWEVSGAITDVSRVLIHAYLIDFIRWIRHNFQEGGQNFLVTPDNFTMRLDKGDTIRIRGPKSEWGDFVYVDDADEWAGLNAWIANDFETDLE